MPVQDLILGSIWYVVFLFSLTAHEASHAWVALRGGDPTAYEGGQVTLDPRPHIRREPFGTVIVPILMFASSGFMMGWASAPFDPAWAQRYPHRAGWMALAGPAANLALVLLAVALIHVGVAFGYFEAPMSISFMHVTDALDAGMAETVATLVSILFTLNLLLFIFNLLPLPPLDGSGAIALFVSEERARELQETMRQPGLAFGGILVAWFVVPEVFAPVFFFLVDWLYPGVTYGS